MRTKKAIRDMYKIDTSDLLVIADGGLENSAYANEGRSFLCLVHGVNKTFTEDFKKETGKKEIRHIPDYIEID